MVTVKCLSKGITPREAIDQLVLIGQVKKDPVRKWLLELETKESVHVICHLKNQAQMNVQAEVVTEFEEFLND